MAYKCQKGCCVGSSLGYYGEGMTDITMAYTVVVVKVESQQKASFPFLLVLNADLDGPRFPLPRIVHSIISISTSLSVTVREVEW